MPKGFSEREKELIRRELLSKGRECFASYGLKKTNIEDLTRAVGISKGAFYLFYDSKEELFFEIMEQFEAEFRATMLDGVFPPDVPRRQALNQWLRRVVEAWKAHPLFTRFSQAEYEHLLRKLPEERVQRHIRNDDDFAAELIARWQGEGVTLTVEPRLLAGLLRALVLLSVHEDDFSAGVYPAVMDVLVALIAQHLLPDAPPAVEVHEVRR